VALPLSPVDWRTMPSRAFQSTPPLPGSTPRTSVALEDLDRRALAGAVGAEECEGLAVGDVEADAVQRVDRAVRLAEVTHADRVLW
jgi:hypothetical protein